VRTRLNLEMAAVQEMCAMAYDVRPDAACLVRERRQELTTEGGLNVVESVDAIRKTCAFLRDGGIEVSIFVDPEADQIRAAHRAGAQCVELHTGKYCDAPNARARSDELERIVDAAKAAKKLGLKVNAGHGLNYFNVFEVAAVQEIEEFNIGHAIVARAVLVGMEQAVRDMVELLRYGRG
jgi:pyridoxine 5-phosphate synthase